MSPPDGQPDDAQERIEAPELGGAGELVRALANALKTSRVHGKRSAAAHGVLDRMHAGLRGFFDAHGLVSLAYSVLPDAICYKGHAVLDLVQAGDPAFTAMTRSGIRQFAFLDELSRETLGDFVELLVDCPLDPTDYDLATLLWERDFEQLSYLVVESFAEDLDSPRFQEELSVLLAAVAAELPVDTVRAARISEDDLRVRAGEAVAGIDSGEDVFDSAYEEECVARILASKEDEVLGPHLVNIMLRLAHGAADPQERELFELRLAGLLEEEIARGRVDSAEQAARLLRQAEGRAKDKPVGRAAAGVIARLSRSPALALLDQPQNRLPPRLGMVCSLLEALDPQALAAAYALARSVTAPESTPAIRGTLVSLASRDPAYLVQQLSTKTAEAARICIPALAATNLRAANAAIVDAYKHGRPEVRLLVVRTLEGRKDGFYRSILLNALTTADLPLHVRAVRQLVSFPDRGPDRVALGDALFASAAADLVAGRSGAELGDIVSHLVGFDRDRTLRLLAPIVSDPNGHPPDAVSAAVRGVARAQGAAAAEAIRAVARATRSTEVMAQCELVLKGLPRG